MARILLEQAVGSWLCIPEMSEETDVGRWHMTEIAARTGEQQNGFLSDTSRVTGGSDWVSVSVFSEMLW